MGVGDWPRGGVARHKSRAERDGCLCQPVHLSAILLPRPPALLFSLLFLLPVLPVDAFVCTRSIPYSPGVLFMSSYLFKPFFGILIWLIASHLLPPSIIDSSYNRCIPYYLL